MVEHHHRHIRFPDAGDQERLHSMCQYLSRRKSLWDCQREKAALQPLLKPTEKAVKRLNIKLNLVVKFRPRILCEREY